MINWKTLVIGTGILITLPLSSYAAQPEQEVNQIFAQRMNHERGDRGERMDKLLQQLDLSPEQSQQINTIREQSKITAEDIMQQMRSQYEQMKSLLASDADTEEIRAQYRENQQLHQQASNNRFETMLRIREVLTSEQRAKIAELMEEHRGGNFAE